MDRVYRHSLLVFHDSCKICASGITSAWLMDDWAAANFIRYVRGELSGTFHDKRIGRLRLKCDGTRAEIWFRLSAKRTSPFKSTESSVQSTTGSRVLRISGSNAGYTVFRGSVKDTGYPLYWPVSPSLPLPCVIVCYHISTGLYSMYSYMAPTVTRPQAFRFLPVRRLKHPRCFQIQLKMKSYNVALIVMPVQLFASAPGHFKECVSAWSDVCMPALFHFECILEHYLWIVTWRTVRTDQQINWWRVLQMYFVSCN